MTPYTTKTGLQIGINYKPKPYIETDKDMLRLQASLLYKRVPFLSMIKACFLVSYELSLGYLYVSICQTL